MLYPSLQTKSIGFLLVFSTFSLCAVGVTFLIFYKTTNPSVINSNQHFLTNDHQKIDDSTGVRYFSESNFNRERDGDTIYIDDYDKIIDDEKQSLKPIDYFDQIIKDHPVINDDEKPAINLVDDDYDDDDDSVNSGSGDFINNDDDDDDDGKIKQKLSLNQDNFYSVSSEIVSKNDKKKLVTMDLKDLDRKDGVWLETRARRIIGNVKKSEERSRQLLLCEDAGSGELCRMLFKSVLNE